MAATVWSVGSRLSKGLGECVRRLRVETGMSQVVFAERCGFYQTYLSRIENGHANPSLNAIEVLANALGLSVFDLFDLVKAAAQPTTAKKRHRAAT
jgi:transcriptional regulator with XRE-family HTH domain